MTKQKLTISILIPILTMIFTIGVSWGVVKNKADKVDKLEEVVVTNDKKIAVLEVKLDNIDENMREQKLMMKEILKAVKQ